VPIDFLQWYGGDRLFQQCNRLVVGWKSGDCAEYRKRLFIQYVMGLDLELAR